jgi:SAM-dependent methyltransferase
MICQICGSGMQRKFARHGYDICECGKCHHQSAKIDETHNHVARVYSDDYFRSGGAGYPDYLGEAKILIDHGRRYARLVSRHLPPGRMLDVGAASGFILKGFIECGWAGRGIEPNGQMAEYARERLGLSVDCGTLEEDTSGETYDLISMIQVVAHFLDLHAAFNAARNRTASGGYLLIETWDKDSLTARIFKERWHEYSPPSVVHWFTPKTLSLLARSFGFAEVARGRPIKWLNGAHARSLLQHKSDHSSLGRAAASLSRLIPARLPIPYPAEDLFWTLYRKV